MNKPNWSKLYQLGCVDENSRTIVADRRVCHKVWHRAGSDVDASRWQVCYAAGASGAAAWKHQDWSFLRDAAAADLRIAAAVARVYLMISDPTEIDYE